MTFLLLSNFMVLLFLKKYTCLDGFESEHQTHKNVIVEKKSSINPLKTMISFDEKITVFNLTGNLIPSETEKTIIKPCSDDIVKNYLKKETVQGGTLYECKKLSVFNTEYIVGQYILLPKSSHNSPVFGKIVKLLSCQSHAYFIFEETSNRYDVDTDLFFLNGENVLDIIPQYQLPCYYPLNSYEVGQDKNITISTRSYVLDHLT